MEDNSLRDVVTAASYPELTGNFITRFIVIQKQGAAGSYDTPIGTV